MLNPKYLAFFELVERVVHACGNNTSSARWRVARTQDLADRGKVFTLIDAVTELKQRVNATAMPQCYRNLAYYAVGLFVCQCAGDGLDRLEDTIQTLGKLACHAEGTDFYRQTQLAVTPAAPCDDDENGTADVREIFGAEEDWYR